MEPTPILRFQTCAEIRHLVAATRAKPTSIRSTAVAVGRGAVAVRVSICAGRVTITVALDESIS